MEDKVRETVRDTFEQYLLNKGLRKTQERFAILDAIYTIEGHFTLEVLYDIMIANRFHVSRATLYNTMELLVDAHLVVRHKFGNTAQYEKSYNMTTHLHRICMGCGSVIELEDDKVRQVIENTRLKGFSIAHASLYMYGMCSKCTAARRRREKKIREMRNNK
ncbi:MAG: transcriptional repressor [Bacteroidaceae bacterium]|jgi:Fur family ferric uptake transcriptional regulator|nr:transcriptional repressor [Bacteroidaceae bacterium]MBO7268046.1 transcriptional repressor [Bacteroidaceae bacterium]